MPTETVTLVLDKSQYERAISEVVAGQGRLSRSGEQIGQGFVRGERVIRTASANIATSLLSGGDAASTLLVAMSGLERVFKIGILPTIGVAAAVAIFEVFHRQIERTEKASGDLREELGKPLGLQVQKSVEGLSTDIDALKDKMAGLRKETNSPTSSILNFFGVGQGFGGSVGSLKAGIPPVIPKQRDAQEQKELIAGEQRLKELATARANTELKISEAKRDQNKTLQLELGYEADRAKLFQSAFRSGLNMLDLMKRLVALQITLKSEILKEVEARHSAVRAARDQFLGSSGDLFKDIGSGQFLKDLAEKRIENQQRQRGIDIAKEFSDFADRGGQLGPNEQAIVDASKKALSKGGLGLSDVSNLDFSNLDILSKYNFKGLEPLNNLTIKIQ